MWRVGTINVHTDLCLYQSCISLVSVGPPQIPQLGAPAPRRLPPAHLGGLIKSFYWWENGGWWFSCELCHLKSRILIDPRLDFSCSSTADQLALLLV